MQMESGLFYPPRNFGAIPLENSAYESSRVVILPVPYDSTTTYKSGVRDGPMAIIDASQYLELYDSELDCEIHRIGIHTLPEVQPVMSSPEDMVQQVYLVARQLLQKGKMVVMLGGEHSISLGMVKALQERFEGLTVLQLDAHADLRDAYLGARYSHASVMRRISEMCPIVQVGIRSLSQEEHQFIKDNGLKPFYIEMLPPAEELAERVVSTLSNEVYITIDLDVLDPSIMSAVGTPEPGGMGWYEVLGLLRSVASRRKIVGFDVVELCPREGPNSCAFLAAKLTYKLIGYAFYPPKIE